MPPVLQRIAHALTKGVEIKLPSATEGASKEVIVTDRSQEILPAREDRKGLVIQNRSTTNAIYVELAKPATLKSVKVAPELSVSYTNYAGSIYGIAEAGKTAQVIIQEMF